MRPTPDELLQEILTNPTGITWTVRADDVETTERIEAIYAPPLGDDSLVVAALNAETTRRNVRVPWDEIWRYLDTQRTPNDGPIPSAPIRYALDRYPSLPTADGAVAAACWMAGENWRHPAYHDVDVHENSFTEFAQALVGAKLLTPDQATHIVNEMGTVPSSRAQELWGIAIAIDDIADARRVDPVAAEALRAERQRVQVSMDERDAYIEQAERDAIAAKGVQV